MNGLSVRFRQFFAVFGALIIVFGLTSTVFSATSSPAGATQLVNLDQWANKPPENWQNGDLNTNNSNYQEGDGVPFQAQFTGLDASSSHLIHINYDFSASDSTYGYDSLGTYDMSDAATHPSGTAQTIVIPSDPIFPIGGYNPETKMGTRLLTVYGAAMGSVTVEAPTHSGNTADVAVHFTPLTNSTTVYMLWAGHLAIGSGGWGTDNGAGSSPGGSLHMRTQYLDGNGARDQNRSVHASALIVVDTPHLVLTKTADATPVVAGNQIGFQIGLSNNGNATAHSVILGDSLPANSGLSWTVAGVTGTGGFSSLPTCAISGGALSCSTVTSLSAGEGFNVHLTSSTTGDSVGTVNNTATANSSDASSPPSATASIDVTPAPTANFVLTKTADATPVVAGNQIGFQIGLSNNGNAAASGVALADSLPPNSGLSWTVAGVTGTGGFSSPPTCVISGGALSCSTVANLPAGEGFNVHLTSSTTVASVGTVTNTTTASSSNTPSPSPASASIEISKVLSPHLVLTKTADATPVVAGNQIGFQIGLSNNGNATAHSVILGDSLPANSGLSWTVAGVTGTGGFTSLPTCAISGDALSCSTVTSLSAGEGFNVHLTSSTTGDSAGTVTNTTTASSSNTPSPNPASAAIVVTRLLLPSLVLTKTADATPVVAGNQIGFQIGLSNNGEAQASNVALSDSLPAVTGLRWSVAGVTGINGFSTLPTCAVTTGDLNCSVVANVPITRGFSVHLISATTAGSVGTITNTVSASASNAATPPPASASVQVSRLPVANLQLAKTADATTVIAGSQAGFQIQLTNTGEAAATDVILSDTLPTTGGLNWTVSGVTSSGGLVASPTCSISNGSLDCSTIASLPAGQGFSVNVVSPTSAADLGTIANTANAQSSNTPAPPPVSATIQVNPASAPVITLTKSSDASRILAGDNIVFHMIVSNEGGGPATDVAIHDNLPTNVGLHWSVESVTANGALGNAPTCAITSNALDCSNVSNLPAGAGFTVHVISRTTLATAASGQGQVLNVASVTVGNSTPPPAAEAEVSVSSLPQILPAGGGTTPTTPETSPLLPFTGGNQILGIMLGLAFMLLGALMLLFAGSPLRMLKRVRRRSS